MSMSEEEIRAPAPVGPRLATLPIVKASSERAGRRLRMLLYGTQGAGKTYLAATASEVPRMSPVIIVDSTVEAGTWSVEDFDVDVLHIDRSSMLERLINDLHKGQLPYKTLVLDNLQEIYNILMAERMAAGGGQAGAEDVPQLRDYLITTHSVRKVIRAAKQLQVHFIATCLDQYYADESSGVLHVKPFITGKLAFQIGALFDIVGHLTAKAKKKGADEVEVVRQLQLQPVGRVEAKDRSGKLGAFFEAPTMPSIAKVLGWYSDD
jgi:hypothetical protein